MYHTIKNRIVTLSREAYDEKLVAGTSGNLSEYDRETNAMVITPSDIHFHDLTEDQIVVMSLDGTILEGARKPSSEWQMHAEIYKQMNHVTAVIHTHSPRATSFAVIHESIPVILVEMMPFLGGDIPLAELALPGTPAVGTAAVKALKNRNSCLLANHGALAVGSDLRQAYLRAVYVEDAAKIYHFARQIGSAKEIPEEMQQTLRERYHLKK